ncbi:hypothetical protein [Methyloraptor flagellatus]|uniref:CD-NTase-associated protein 12/Pycsar effector protein TIR domain-containing protein n=1 Tax=Methyloraptor flagellatus TaxID=3162530 RepID=A0AAU7X9G6_9HYPH
MLISILGSRTALTNWICLVARELLSECYGSYHTIEASSLEDFQRLWSERDGRAVIVILDTPSTSIVNVLKKLSLPALLCVEDFGDSVGYQVDAHQSDIYGAVRHAVRGLCHLHDFFIDPTIPIWSRDRIDVPLAEVISALAGTFGIAVEASQIDRIASRIAGQVALDKNCTGEAGLRAFDAHAREPGAFYRSRSEVERAVLDGVFSGYKVLMDRRPITTLRWPRQVFSSHDVPFGTPDWRLDLTGRARHLVFGPYLHLPRGQWKANIRFAIDNALSGCKLFVDVLTAGAVASFGEIENLPARGVFTFDLEFEVTDPATPIEIRIEMKYGSIEGLFIFDDVELYRA